MKVVVLIMEISFKLGLCAANMQKCADGKFECAGYLVGKCNKVSSLEFNHKLKPNFQTPNQSASIAPEVG